MTYVVRALPLSCESAGEGGLLHLLFCCPTFGATVRAYRHVSLKLVPYREIFVSGRGGVGSFLVFARRTSVWY